jgi:tRNA (cytidine/uridine-2'-O-)-methyltransferase
MFHVVLFEPEIPPNTGNIIRLCANTGAQLHLIEPLGFPLEHSKLRRAGLDYHEFANVLTHPNWNQFLEKQNPDPQDLFVFTTRGRNHFASVQFKKNSYFIFGSETKGVSDEIRNKVLLENQIRLPMRENSRSLNLSNTVAIVVYEAWRQNQFWGGS